MGDYSAAAVEVEDMVYVAVGSVVEVGKSLLEWTLRRFVGRRIGLVHVRLPSLSGSSVDWMVRAEKIKQLAMAVPCEGEMQKLLNEYTSFLSERGVDADTQWIEMTSIERGIVGLIAQHNIRCLVMGSSSRIYDSKRPSEPKSEKTLFICKEAPKSCRIWFVFKGCLVYTREITDYRNERKYGHPSHLTSPEFGIWDQVDFEPKHMMGKQKSLSSLPDEKDPTINYGIEPWPSVRKFSSQRALRLNLPKNNLPDPFDSPGLLSSQERKSERKTFDELNHRQQGLTKTEENLNQEAFDESVNQWNTEEDISEASITERKFESLCATEINRKQELEEILTETTREIEKTKNTYDEHVKQVELILEQIPALERQLAESIDEIKEYHEKITAAVELLKSFKDKRDHMREERGKAVAVIKSLNKLLIGQAGSLNGLPNLTVKFSDVSEATQTFDPSRKIGEGRNGSVYQGFLGQQIVAIKMLPDYGSKGHLEFQQEVEAISRIRHPHLVTLVGSSPESQSLIYEYLENGSLEDRLICKGKTLPFLWQTRIRIAAEICSVLIFLNSNKPPIVHGNLKPSKVLLGAHLVSKLSDLGVSRLVQQKDQTDPRLASEYTDPEYVEMDQLTPESDLFSFGVILLRLLTGRQPSGLLKDVTCALDKGNFELILDTSAGDWPAEVTEQLLYLALKCCERNRSDRPDLWSEIWSVLEPMKRSCISMTASGPSKGNPRPPPHFVCPIFQEVFENPKIASDGYTYEAEAIEGWLNSGHNTSPMTNLKLDHCSLIPNYALHYAIQEWQQKF